MTSTIGTMVQWMQGLLKKIEDNPSLKPWTKTFNQERKLSLGIDIGTYALRYVLTEAGRNRVVKWGTLPFESPRDKKDGEKKEVRSLSFLLRELAKIIPKNQLCQIDLNLQDLSVVMGHFEIPVTNKSEEAELIKLTLRDQLSFPIEEAEYFCSRYYPTEASVGTKERGTKRAVYNFAAVPKKPVQKLVDAIDEVFEMIPDISLQGYALESLLKPLELAKPGEIIAFLNMGRSTTIVSVFQDFRLVFERHIPLGGQDMTRAIFIMYLQGTSPRTAQDLGEAEKVKRQSYIPLASKGSGLAAENAGESGLSEEENRKLFKVIDGLLAAWIQDARLSLSFFNENYTAQKISKIYLIGGGANLRNFGPYLTQELGVDASLLTFPVEGRTSLFTSANAGSLKRDFHEYATALAMSLKPAGYATFTPKEYKALAIEHVATSVLRSGAVIAFSILLTWFIFLFVQNKNLVNIRSVFMKHQGFVEKIEGPYLEMMRWQNFLEGVDTTVPKASLLLKVISRRVPPNVILTRGILNREQTTLLLEGVVEGNANRRAVTLVDFSKALEESGYFRRVEVPSLERNSAQPNTGFFKIKADLIPNPKEKP